ncbi:MAG: heme-binding protein [Sulfuricellaceae bacterium]
MKINLMATFILLCASFGTQAQEATFTTQSLTPESALTAAQAALAQCRKNGYQAAVTVVDKAGLTLVVLRDRYAGAHTVEVSANKAWTAVSFKTATAALAEETQPGKPMSGLRNLPRFLAAGGGLMIEGAGVLLGGIGVSGAPGGEADAACAKAGIQAIAESLEF